MEIQNNDQEIGPKIINTFNGKQKYQEIKNSIKRVVYQTLQFLPNKDYQSNNKTINLQNIKYHINNPYSLQNTAITPSMLQSQFHNISIQKQLILIIDSSHNYQTKQIPQIFKKYKVVKGFSYTLQKNVLKNSPSLYQLNHIKTQIQYQFNLGNGVYHPSFIGQIDLSYLIELYEEFKEDQIILKRIDNVIMASLLFSKKTNCPILINCSSLSNSLGSQKSKQINLSLIVSQHDLQKNQNSIKQIKKRYQIISQILQKAFQLEQASKNLIVCNLPILLIHKIVQIQNKSYSQVYNYFEQISNHLREKYNFTVLYQGLRYNNNQNSFLFYDQIASQIVKFPNKTIITAGVNFKTDLKNFGGRGIFSQEMQNYLKKFCKIKQDLFFKVFQSNFLEMLSWKNQKKVIVEIRYWKCDACQKDFEQKVEAFRKHGKQFCSIKCLKSFNF